MRILVLLLACLPALAAPLPDCTQLATQLNQRLGGRLDQPELSQVLRSLSQHGELPAKFIRKAEARRAGWRPGRSLWAVPGLEGRSMGGDVFRNFEGRLPQGQWREADLNYRGAKRGAQRLVFEARPSGRRFVSVDHYNQFTEAPACR